MFSGLVADTWFKKFKNKHFSMPLISRIFSCFVLFVHSKDSVKPDIALNLSTKDSKDQETIQIQHLSKGIKWESNKSQ